MPGSTLVLDVLRAPREACCPFGDSWGRSWSRVLVLAFLLPPPAPLVQEILLYLHSSQVIRDILHFLHYSSHSDLQQIPGLSLVNFNPQDLLGTYLENVASLLQATVPMLPLPIWDGTS